MDSFLFLVSPSFPQSPLSTGATGVVPANAATRRHPQPTPDDRPFAPHPLVSKSPAEVRGSGWVREAAGVLLPAGGLPSPSSRLAPSPFRLPARVGRSGTRRLPGAAAGRGCTPVPFGLLHLESPLQIVLLLKSQLLLFF
ncbi:hypothetical protein BRADI_3g30990v3 [Brachypodium distachyon]|uniref:Uncharacterized protein n=1 Tax=Brachypodium distachyon TaxID=15368 RepID=A0A2K2D0D5_BRADI|nr:hypothetical protein BRADI_3g30990v3 [Brachypodium distachyon]